MDNSSFDFATLLGRQAPQDVQPKPQGWLDKLSRGFDTALNWTGVPQQFGQAGEAIGRGFGPTYAEQGYQLGQGLPRSFLELGAQGEALPLKLAGILSSAAHAHEQTGSWGQGAIAGASTGLMPASATLGSKFVGRPLANMFGQGTADGLAVSTGGRIAGIAERIADYTGANVGAVANQEAARQASSLAAGTGWQNPVSGENLFNVGMGNLPFAALHLPGLVEGKGFGNGMERSTSEGERIQDTAKEVERRYMDTANRDPSPIVETPKPLDIAEPLAPKVELPTSVATLKDVPIKVEVSKATLGGEPVTKPTFQDYVTHEQRVKAEQARLLTMMPKPEQQRLLLAPPKVEDPSSVVKALNETAEAAKPLVEQPLVTTSQIFDMAKAKNEIVEQLRDKGYQEATPDKLTDDLLTKIYTEHFAQTGDERESVKRTAATVQDQLNQARLVTIDATEHVTRRETTQKERIGQLGGLAEDEQKKLTTVLRENEAEADPTVHEAIYRAAGKWVEGGRGKSGNFETFLRESARRARTGSESKYQQNKVDISGYTTEEGNEVSRTTVLENLMHKEATTNPIAQGIANEALHKVAAHLGDKLDSGGFTEDDLEHTKYHDKAQQAERINLVMQHYAEGLSKKEVARLGKFGGETQVNTFIQREALPFLRDYFKNDMPQMWPDFEHSGLEKREGVVGNAIISTNAFFSRYGDKLFGPNQSVEKELFTRTATRIASLFPGVKQIRVGELLGTKVRGTFIPKDNQILINQQNQGNTFFEPLKVLGHEFIHGVQEAFIGNKLNAESKEAFSKFREWGESLETEEKANVIDALYGSIYPAALHNGVENEARFKQMVNYASSSQSEFEAEVGGLFAMGMAAPSAKFNDLAEYIKFSPQALTDFAKMQYVNLNDSVNAIAAMHELSGQEHVALSGMQENLAKLAKTSHEIASAGKALADIQARTSPENYLRMVQDASAPTKWISQVEKEWLDDRMKLYPDFKSISDMARAAVGFGPDKEKLFGIEPGFYDRNLVPMGQLAEKYPTLRPIFDLAIGFRSLSNKFATMALSPFMTKKSNGKMVFDDTHGNVSKIVNTKGASDVFNQIHLEKNELQRVLTDSELKQRVASLPAATQEAVINITHATEKAMPQVASQILAFREHTFTHQFAHILISNEGYSTEFAIQKAKALWESYNPEQLPQGADPNAVLMHAKAASDAQKAEFASLQPKTQMAIMGHYESIKQPWEKFKANLVGTPEAPRDWYSPEVRLGRYMLSYKSSVPSNSKATLAPTFTSFDSRAELEARMATLKGRVDIDTASIHTYDKVDSRNATAGWNKDFAGTWADVEKASFESLKNKLDPEDYETVAKNYHPGQAIMKEVASQGLSKHFMQRKLVAGRDDLDMLQGILNYIPKMAYGLSKGYAKEQLGLHMRDQEMVSNPKIRRLAQDYMGSQLDAPPDGKVVRGIKDTIFHYFLGANLSSLFVVGSHPLAVLAPWLTRQGSSLVGSYKLMGKANMELIGRYQSGHLSDPVMEQELQKSIDKGLVDKGILNEFTNNEDVQFTNLRNFSTGDGDLSTTAKLLAKPLYWYNQFTRGMFNGVAGHNSRVAWVSGYMLAKERGLSPEARVTFAERTATSAAFVGGKANRPVGLFANSGKYNGSVGLLYSLQSFQAGATASMIHYLQESLGRSGLKGTELSQARRALGQMVVTQTAMAGAFGLPLAGAMTGIAQQLFPGLDVKKTVRETLQGLAGQDKDMGNLLGDVANNGIVGAMLPFDPSNRITLGNTLGVSPESGFHAENLFGPTGSIVENLVKGVQSASQGQWSQSAEALVPQGWKNVVRLANHNGEFLDSSGRKVFEPTDVEKFFQGIGLRPTRLARLQEEQKSLQRSDEASKRDLQNFHQEQAQKLGQGDFAGVRKALVDRQDVDQNYDARAGLRRVVELAQERLQVRDLTRGGPRKNIDQRSQIASMFGQQERPSEVQSLMQRKQMEQAVGIQGVGQVTPTEMSHAQMIDHVMQTQPGLTRQQAGQMVEHMFRQRSLVH